MSSSLRVNTIVPSTGTNVAIGTANGTVTFTDSVNFVLGTGSSIFSPASNTLTFGTNDAERLRIDSAGKMGLGTQTPDKLLTVSGENTVARFKSSTTYVDLIFQNDTKDNGYIQYNNLGNLNFYADSGSTPTLTIKGGSPGNLGIGDASPTKPLTVGTTTPVILLDDQSSRTLEIRGPSTTHNATVLTTSNHDLLLGTNNAERFRIKSDGKAYFTSNLGLGGQTSPTSHIHIGDISANGYELRLSANALTFNRSSSSYIDQLHDTGRILFRTGSSYTETMRIESNGKIGINDTSPDANLSVGGSTAFVDIGAAGGNRAKIGYSSNDCYFGTSSSSGQFIFKNNVGSNDNPASSGTERLRITSAGYVLKSDTPAFKCKLSGATGANFTGAFVFGNVSYNIGSHYNSSNGRFTAPVDGRYLFSWYTNMERAGGNGSFYADWMINGSNQGNRMYTHHSGTWELIGGTVIFDLNANDYVQINAITSGNWDGGQYGSYSGYLLG